MSVRYERKAQMSVFIIIGLVVMMIFFFLIYIVNVFFGFGDVPPPADEIKFMAQQCIKSSAEKGLLILGSQGGYISLSKPYFGSEFSNITYNSYLPTKESIAFELEEYINNHVVECMHNFTKSRHVKIDDPKSKVRFSTNNLIITVNHFLTICTNNTEEMIDTIQTDAVRVRFPAIYDMVSNLEDDRINMDTLAVPGFNTSVFSYPAQNTTVYVITDLESAIMTQKYKFMTATSSS